jgi:phosphoribosylglycinamide formyltransferase-1
MNSERSSPRGLVVLISGRGSNLVALAEAAASGVLGEPVLAAISDQPDAAGLRRAAEHRIDGVCIDRRQHADRASFEASLDAAIAGFNPRYIVLAGFMRVLSAEFVNRRHGQMINIHPSLLPRHRGLETHARALAAGDREHGASVHFVTPALDGGPVISQARIEVGERDTPEALATRLLPLEHRLLVLTTALLLNSTVELDNETISINGRGLEQPLDLDHDLAPRVALGSGVGADR